MRRDHRSPRVPHPNGAAAGLRLPYLNSRLDGGARSGRLSCGLGVTERVDRTFHSVGGMDDVADELALWKRVLAGDDTAFTAVFDLHVSRVHRQARRLVNNERDAEDVTAIVFFEAWRRRGSVRLVNDSLVGWLLVTTTNVARNRERSQSRYEALLRKVRVETVPDHADAVLESVARPAQDARVRDAFDRLSARDQEILTLCVIEELAPVDVARVLRVPAGTVRMRLSRAKTRLRAALQDAQLVTTTPEIEGAAP